MFNGEFLELLKLVIFKFEKERKRHLSGNENENAVKFQKTISLKLLFTTASCRQKDYT